MKIRTVKIRTVIAVAALLLPQSAAAEIGPVGAEFQVNSQTVYNQRFPAMAASADGSFVVVWSSVGQILEDGTQSGIGVFGQRYDSIGHTVGTEFQVNSFTANWQSAPAVAAGADGAFVVVWTSVGEDGSEYTTGLLGQRYDSAGQPVGAEFRVNTYTRGFQYEPAVAASADGVFVVAWSSVGQDDDETGVFAQRFDSAGLAIGTEFQVNAYTPGGQGNSAVAAGVGGTFVVVWNAYDYTQGGSLNSVFGRRYDSVGQPLGPEFQINTSTASDQFDPAVAASAEGSFVVVWFGSGPPPHRKHPTRAQWRALFSRRYVVFGQRYDSAGQAVGTEFQVNTYTEAAPTSGVVGTSANGAFVVVWENHGQDGNYGAGVFAQRYDSVGHVVGAEFQVNSYTVGFQNGPVVAVGANGAFIVAWNSFSGQDGSDSGVFAQRFAVLPPCAGDCDRNGTLSIDELITGVAAALDLLPIDDCPAFDADKSGQITIDELVAAVDAALHGCTD